MRPTHQLWMRMNFQARGSACHDMHSPCKQAQLACSEFSLAGKRGEILQ